MTDEISASKTSTSFLSRRVSLGFLLLAILISILDGLLLAPILFPSEPSELDRLWPSVTAAEDPAAHPYKKDYRFTTDWFSHNISVWATVLKEFQGKADVRYLEIGTWEGRSLLWALDNIFTHPTSRLTAIDPLFDDPGWPASKDIKGTLFSNIKLSGEESRVDVIVGFSQTELRKLPLESYDVVYVDGSHTSYDTLEDLVLSFRLLKPGGLLIMDDYQGYTSAGTFDRPKFSMDAFYACFRNQVEVVHFGWQVILKKKAQPA